MKRLQNIVKWLPCVIAALAVVVSGVAETIESPTREMMLSNMGREVNSAGDDFFPTITADGSTMVFSKRPDNEESSDIYISTHVNGTWTKARPIDEINTKLDEQTPYISPDGKMLLFSSNREGSIRPPRDGGKVYFLTNDLYVSYKKGGEWSPPQRLSGEVNTVDNERAPSLSGDGKILYFSRYRGDDIYSSKIYSATLDGISTGNVAPLPQPINSGYSDFAFMPSHSRPGFYFSSSRPEGLGLWDIYFVSYINNEFGIPINLGEPINSEFNDLSITEVGNVIYFCSDRNDGLGKSDIYTIAISKKVFQIPDTGFKLYVVDKKSRDAISTKLDVSVARDAGEDDGADKKFVVESDGNGIGEFKIGFYSKLVTVKPADARFGQKVIRLDPAAGEIKSVIIELEKAVKQEEAPKLAVESPAPPRDYRFGPIYFEYRSSEIPGKEHSHVRKIAGVLKGGKDLCVKIAGHSDPKGSWRYNMKLGYARALAVKNALVKNGLKNIKYDVISLGEGRPSALYRKTGRQEYNRRVEVTVEECANSNRGK
jgi:outer membrane protein OmpA-like peptidoglycan-associated protein